MRGVFSAIDVGNLEFLIVRIFLAHGHGGQQIALVVAEGEFLAFFDRGSDLFGGTECHRDWPYAPIGQSHSLAD
jgi:hypothetical protein